MHAPQQDNDGRCAACRSSRSSSSKGSKQSSSSSSGGGQTRNRACAFLAGQVGGQVALWKNLEPPVTTLGVARRTRWRCSPSTIRWALSPCKTRISCWVLTAVKATYKTCLTANRGGRGRCDTVRPCQAMGVPSSMRCPTYQDLPCMTQGRGGNMQHSCCFRLCAALHAATCPKMTIAAAQVLLLPCVICGCRPSRS